MKKDQLLKNLLFLVILGNLCSLLPKTYVKTEKINDEFSYITEISIHNKKNIFLYSNEEFQKEMQYKSITINDLYEVLEKNLFISPFYKELIKEYIDNINKDINLSVLYYNLGKLRIKTISKEEIKNEAGISVVAYFDPVECSITCSFDSLDDKNKYLFFHELSHASVEAYYEDKKKKVCKTNVVYQQGIEKNTITRTSSLTEGIDDYFTYRHQEFLENYDMFSYEEFNDVINLLSLITNTSIEEIQNKGIINFLNEVDNQKIIDINKLTTLMDTYLNEIKNHEMKNRTNGFIMRNEIYVDIFKNLTQKWINEGMYTDEIYFYILKYLEQGFIENQIMSGNELFILAYHESQRKIKDNVLFNVMLVLKENGLPAIGGYNNIIDVYETVSNIMKNKELDEFGRLRVKKP